MKWFRLWTDIMDNHKIAQLTDYEFKIFIYLLAHCSEVDSMSGECQLNVKSMSIRFRTQINHLSHAIETFHRIGLTTLSDAGFIIVNNWNKRQYKSDNVTNRVRKFREVVKKRNVSCNVSETAPDTDTDTDTDIKHNPMDYVLPVSAETGLTKNQKRIEKLKTEKQQVREKIREAFGQHRDFLRTKYPNHDLDFELASMLDWIDTDFTKAKKRAAGNLNLFFQRWLNRARAKSNFLNPTFTEEDQHDRIRRIRELALKAGKIIK